MTNNQIKVTLGISYLLTTFYSFYFLADFSLVTGPRNARITLVFVGFFLLVSSALLLFGLIGLMLADKNGRSSVFPVVMGVVAMVLWLMVLLAVFPADPFNTLVYGLPGLFTPAVTIIFAVILNRRLKAGKVI